MAARSAVMVGRDTEVSLLLGAMSRAEAGEAQLALVRGEAGIGKTRLVRELVAQVPNDTVVAFGHAVPLSGGSLPYGVVADLLRWLVREVHPKTVADVLGDRTRVLAPLVPQLADGPAPSVDRLALYAASQDLLVELAADRLLVLVVEDAHWADESSLDLLTFLARTLVRGRLLLLVTSRSRGAEEVVLERVAELRRLPNACGIDLECLDDDGVEQQVRSLDSSADHDLVTAVQRLSEGNPLYVEELLSDGKIGMSASLQLDLASCLERVRPESVPLLQLASLEHRPFAVGRLAAVAQAPLDEVATALDEAFGVGLLEPAGKGRWRFHHELLRRAVASSAPPSGSMRGHRAWATALLAGGRPNLDDLVTGADHLHALGATRESFEAYVKAAEVSSIAAPSKESEALWQRALSVIHETPQVATEEEHIHVLGGAASVLTGLTEWRGLLRREQAFSATPPKPIRDFLAVCQSDNVGIFVDEQAPELTTPDLMTILDGLAAREVTALDYITTNEIVAQLHGRGEAGPRDRAVDLLARMAVVLPAWITSGMDLVTDQRIWSLVGPGDEDRRLDLAARGVEAARDRDWASRSWAYGVMARELWMAGRFEAALRNARQSMAYVPSEEHERHWYVGALAGAYALYWLGDWDEAARLASRCRESDTPVFLALLIGVARGENVLPYLVEPTAVDPEETKDLQFIRRLGRALALTNSDLERTRTEVAALLGEQPLPGRVPATMAFAGSLAVGEPAADSGYLSKIRDALETGLRESTLHAAVARHVNAHLARVERTDAPAAWEEAINSWESLSVPFFAAQCRLRLAELLLADGDRDGAGEALGAALAVAESLQARPLADEIRALAGRARLRLPGHESRTPGDTGGLTAREHEVLQLLVQGLTNDQIGSALFMSPRTASVHVSRILAKLGAANRTEVAAVAHRRGLVGD